MLRMGTWLAKPIGLESGKAELLDNTRAKVKSPGVLVMEKRIFTAEILAFTWPKKDSWGVVAKLGENWLPPTKMFLSELVKGNCISMAAWSMEIAPKVYIFLAFKPKATASVS